MYNNMASDLVKFGGILKCSVCGRETKLTEEDIVYYMANGWLRCCGYTMTWITERQLKEKNARSKN